jgi:hypothetical protein
MDSQVQLKYGPDNIMQHGISNIYTRKRSWGEILRHTKSDGMAFERADVMSASKDWYAAVLTADGITIR